MARVAEAGTTQHHVPSTERPPLCRSTDKNPPRFAAPGLSARKALVRVDACGSAASMGVGAPLFGGHPTAGAAASVSTARAAEPRASSGGRPRPHSRGGQCGSR